MKQQKWIVGPVVMALALGTADMLLAQPTTDGTNDSTAGRQRRANRAAKRVRAARGVRVVMPTPQMLQRMLGKPLTEVQRKAVDDAVQVYMDSVAKAVGLTPDELKTRALEYRRAQRDARRGTIMKDQAAPEDE